MNITNLPILLEIALKDRFVCQLLCQASKAFHNKVYRENNGESYYNLLFSVHGFLGWSYHCKRGNLRAIKWFYMKNMINGNSRPWPMDIAIYYGHLELVQWLHHNRTEGCSIYAMDCAAQNGHLEVIKWLHHNRTEGCTIYAMDHAAQNGHLEIVKWLHYNRSEGCTANAIDSAAIFGHLEVVQWLITNRNQRCTDGALHLATRNGHHHIVEFLNAISD